MTFDELLTLLPGLRRFRSLNAALLRGLLDRQRGECTWCGRSVPKGSRTWCSDTCVTAFKEHCCPNDQRRLVEKRDLGICQKCLRDTNAAERQGRKIPRPSLPYTATTEARQQALADYLAALRPLGYARGQWREVDHKTPVTEYGGLCGLDNLWLLCGVCHEEATARLAQRRANKTKVQKTPS